MSETIAGHPRSIVSQGWCVCGVLWSKLRYVTKECLGLEGYAHVGKLNERELADVEKETEAEAARIEAAMKDLAGGRR